MPPDPVPGKVPAADPVVKVADKPSVKVSDKPPDKSSEKPPAVVTENDLCFFSLINYINTSKMLPFQIALLDRAAAVGARLRARVRWAEEKEMCLRFFLRQERKRGVNGWLSAIRRTDGSLATDISSICESWVEFCSGLFTADPVDFSAQGSLLGCLTARLPGEARDSCEGLLSTEEVFKALEGFPAEFYRALWHVLGTDLVDVLNDSFSSGSLPLSLRGALISLIHKKGDCFECKN